jgi:hypothetical protein
MGYEPRGRLLWQEEFNAGGLVIGKGPVKGQVRKALSQLEKQLRVSINESPLPRVRALRPLATCSPHCYGAGGTALN